MDQAINIGNWRRGGQLQLMTEKDRQRAIREEYEAVKDQLEASRKKYEALKEQGAL